MYGIWANDVKSGDPDNLEARAAAFFGKIYLQILLALLVTEKGFLLIIY